MKINVLKSTIITSLVFIITSCGLTKKNKASFSGGDPASEKIVEISNQDSAQSRDGLGENLDRLDREEDAVKQKLADAPVGLKSGTQIYQSQLALTGVTETAALREVFTNLQSGLPGFSHKVGNFTEANMSSILKLSVEVCDAMVQDNTLKTQFFAGCSIEKTANALSSADISCVANALTSKFWNQTYGYNMDKNIQNSEAEKILIDLRAGMANSETTQATSNLLISGCTYVATSLPSLLQ